MTDAARIRQIYAEKAMMGALGGIIVGGALKKGSHCRKGAIKKGPSGKKRCTKYVQPRAPAKKKVVKKKGGIIVGGEMDMGYNYYGEGKKKAAAKKPSVPAAKSDNPWIRYISCLAKVQGLNYSEALKYYSANKAQLQSEYIWFKEHKFKLCQKKKLTERRGALYGPGKTPIAVAKARREAAAKKKAEEDSDEGYEIVDYDPVPLEFIEVLDEEEKAADKALKRAKRLGKQAFANQSAQINASNLASKIIASNNASKLASAITASNNASKLASLITATNKASKLASPIHASIAAQKIASNIQDDIDRQKQVRTNPYMDFLNPIGDTPGFTYPKKRKSSSSKKFRGPNYEMEDLVFGMPPSPFVERMVFDPELGTHVAIGTGYGRPKRCPKGTRKRCTKKTGGVLPKRCPKGTRKQCIKKTMHLK